MNGLSLARRLMFPAMILITAVLILTGCGLKNREIPMESFVDIWFRMQSDQAFRQQYPDPVKAPDHILTAYTEPFGFKADDFRHTWQAIDKDESMKKEFQEISKKHIDKMALETLNEMTEKDSLLNKP